MMTNENTNTNTNEDTSDTRRFKIGDAVGVSTPSCDRYGEIVGYERHDFTGRRTYVIRFENGEEGGGYVDRILF